MEEKSAAIPNLVFDQLTSTPDTTVSLKDVVLKTKFDLFNLWMNNVLRVRPLCVCSACCIRVIVRVTVSI